MNIRTIMYLLCLSVLTMGQLVSQTPPPELNDLIDRWQEEGVSLSDDEIDEIITFYEDLQANPVNLNDTASGLIRLQPFVGDLRLRILKAYIEQHGFLFSVEELLAVNGFDAWLVDLLRPIVDVQPILPRDTLSLQDLLKRGHGNFTFGGGRHIARARGYTDTIYEGDPLRLAAVFRYNYRDRIQLLLAAEKDPGEAFFGGANPQGFDHYNGYLLLRKFGIVQNVIVGRYNLQFGQGLTLWTGFAPYTLTAGQAGRSPRGILGASAYAEYGFMQGAAAQVKLLPLLALTAFYSNAARDANLDTLGHITSLYNSGLHRTETELSHELTAREQIYGTHIDFCLSNTDIGITVAANHLSDSLMPAARIYNYYTFRGQNNFNFGIDFRHHFDHLYIYGEASLSHSLALAATIGALIDFGNNHSLQIAARHFDADYYNLHSKPYAMTSQPHGEQGIHAAYQLPLPWHLQAGIDLDAYRLSVMRYGIYAPSDGANYRLSLSQTFSKQLILSLQYTSRLRGANTSGSTERLYIVENTARRLLTADLRWKPDPFLLHTRASLCWYDTETQPQARGAMIYEEVQYQLKKPALTLAARLMLFNADSYNARLNAAESDIGYGLGSSAYSGKGLRAYFLARYAINKHWFVAAKYALTTYADVETIGTGYEQMQGNYQQTVKIQLRWKF